MATEIVSGGAEYEVVAASQTDQVLGTTGATGDVLSRLVICPITTAAGSVSIKDGTGSAIKIFETGTLADLSPFSVEIGAISTSGAWKVSTGANVNVLAIGRFS